MTRTTDERRRAHAARLYAGGASTRQIAGQIGVHRSTVTRWLAGAARPRGPRPDRTADGTILRMREQGASYAAIAAQVGMSASGVRWRHHALTGRPRPDRGATVTVGR